MQGHGPGRPQTAAYMLQQQCPRVVRSANSCFGHGKAGAHFNTVRRKSGDAEDDRRSPAMLAHRLGSPDGSRLLRLGRTRAARGWRGRAGACDSSLGGEVPGPDGQGPLVAVEGDTVTLHYTCLDEQGQKLESSRDADEPVTFELGAGEVFANPVFKAFDEAVRGLAVGERAYLKCGGSEWNRELLFEVERSHPEIERLEGRYKNVGGLAAGLVVELANGSNAVVLAVTEDVVRLDANSMLAGKQLIFELDLISIESAV